MSNESKQSSIVREKMIALSNVNLDIAAECNSVPGVEAVLRTLVADALRNLNPQLDMNKIYITKVAADPKGVYQPQGSLFQVFQDCLERRQKPQYTIGVYGVYDQPDSTSLSAQVKNLSIYNVEKLVENLLVNLVPGYGFTLNDYWVKAVGNDAQGRRLLPPNERMEQLYAKAFWAELDVVVHNGSFTAYEQGWIDKIYSASRIWPQSIFNVSLVGSGGQPQVLPGAFVIQIDGATQNELVSGNDGRACALYLPNDGIRRFADAQSLHRAFTDLLSVDNSRQALLEELPVEGGSSLKGTLKVRFLSIKEDLFKFCAAGQFEKQMLDIAHYWKKAQQAENDFSAVTDAIHRAQCLNRVVLNSRARAARYLQQATKNAWPQWLKAASAIDQSRHKALESAHLESDVALYEETKTASSFKAFARASVADFLFSARGLKVDPDYIFVLTRYEISVGESVREGVGDRRSLTEVFMWGAHDEEYPYELKLEAAEAFPSLTPTFLLDAIKFLDLRVKYAAHRQKVYGLRSVQEAMLANLSCVTALSLFRAGLQKHLGAAAFKLVESYHLGNSVNTRFCVTVGANQPLRDVVVYSERGTAPEPKIYVLYMPGCSLGREWFEFNSLKDLQKKILELRLSVPGREYLNRQTHAGNRDPQSIEGLSLSEYIYDNYFHKQYKLIGDYANPEKALLATVQNFIAWGAAEEELATPAWYRTAQLADRHLHTRLGTEKKIIRERAKKWIGVESLNTFSRNLVHKVINDELRRQGGRVEVDPDQVIIKLKGQEYMTLTQLFINWQLWERVSVVGGSMANLPDSSFPNVSSLKTVDGNDMQGLPYSLINRFIVLRPADEYVKYLKGFTATSDTSLLEYRCMFYARLKQNEMLMDALEQKMQHALSDTQFEWLKDIIDDLHLDPGTTPWAWSPKPGNTGIRAFHIAGKRVEGAYIFSNVDMGKSEHLLYLPGASGVKRFRSFESFSKDFISREIQTAILNGVSAKDRGAVDSYFDKKSLVGVSWDVFTEGQNHLVNFYRGEFVRGVNRIITDVDSATVSFSEKIIADVLVVVDLVADIVSLFFPPVGLVAGVARVIRGVVNGVIAYSNGDDKAANAYFAAAWVQGIKIYLGAIAPIGGGAAGFDMLSRIEDMAGIVSTMTGVPVGVGYITYVAD